MDERTDGRTDEEMAESGRETIRQKYTSVGETDSGERREEEVGG